MSLDLLIKNASLADGTPGQDIAVKSGMIVEVGRSLPYAARHEIDAAGYLVSPPFVDAHFHLDSALTVGLPRHNQSGTLLEGIAVWGELKPSLRLDHIVERAVRYCDLAVAQGLLAIRSHVDVSHPDLVPVEALLEVRRQVKSYIDLQLVAFPQDGLLRQPGCEDQLLRALDMGVDVVGGIPHHERTCDDGTRSVERLCKIAAARGLFVDMHCDETDDPASRHIETLAYWGKTLGLAGRVAGSHCTSMHSMDNYYASKLVDLIADAELSIIANPTINLTLQGRHDTYPKRRGMTRVPELKAAGVNVAFGQDCMMDPWYPLGCADMLEVAAMGIHAAPMTSRAAMAGAFSSITTNAAATLGLQGYGMEKGCKADLVILQARDPIEAIRIKATRLYVVRSGAIIAQSSPRASSLFLDGRPTSVTSSEYAPP